MIDLATIVHPSWIETFKPVQDVIDNAARYLNENPNFLPSGPNVFRAFSRPIEETKCILLGQDPYPTPGNAVGLSFSVSPGVKPPKSLINIYTELHDDLGINPPTTGDLTPWFNQGVLLLNRSLTVTPYQANSHANILGWEKVTYAALESLCQRHSQGQALVALLWGKNAQSIAPLCNTYHVPHLDTAHPSPLSAYRGFFGSKPFSWVNNELIKQQTTPINWDLN